MANKIFLNKRRLAWFALCLITALALVKIVGSSDLKMTLGEWENVHQWRLEGRCMDCHSGHEYVREAPDRESATAIPPAKYHSERFRRLTHGREDGFGSHRCSACHETKACIACHAHLPQSHSSDFMAPTGRSLGSLRHIALARAGTAGCLACHRSFYRDCTQCHTPDEVRPWQSEAGEQLIRWRDLLG
jgi:hypothetical protein